MMATRTTERAATIERINERIKSLTGEMGRMRSSSQGFQDRRCECESLIVTRTRLEALGTK